MTSLRSLSLLLLLPAAAAAQDGPPVIRSNTALISIRDGATLRRDAWTLAPEARPDVYEVDLESDAPRQITFITDVDSISFLVHLGERYDFVILHGADSCFTEIAGVRIPPAAVFDRAFQEANRGQIRIEVPEVYELVNVAIGLTRTGMADNGLVYQKSPYYRAVQEWFRPYQKHPLVTALDSALSSSLFAYAPLKMNGRAFEFDRGGRIVRSPIYDRTGFRDERRNALLALLALMQSFADTTRFRAFYRRHRSTYAGEIAFFRDTAGIDGMRQWLDRQFPASHGYDLYRIVFSPLVAYNQSSTWFESNGFSELQPHVNFPYVEDLARHALGGLSGRGAVLFRGNIVFTEINHGYINPEADRYAGRVLEATSRRDRWVDPARGPGYYGGIAAFNEYMNWALVSLRAVDYAPRNEQEAIIAAVDRMMVERRGFPQFAAFDAFLVDLYRTRAPGVTIAELYPRIIDWFAQHNQE